MNFWQELKKKNKPILCLAPMADVTDAAFRQIIAKYSKPNMPRTRLDTYVTYTEFVSADGLVLAPEEGKEKLLKNFQYSENERPIVAQIFGSNPENIEKAAKWVAELGFDGVDINMGCPDRSVEKQGAGAALIKNPKLAREIIAAAKRGVQNRIPVSVKTRLGYNKDELETWLPELLAENPAAVILHARTRKEMSKVPARWDRVKRAVEIRNSFKTSPRSASRSDPLLEAGEGGNGALPLHLGEGQSTAGARDEVKTLIIGNGDVSDIEDAIKKCQETGADGAMLGRAVFGNPWLFANLASAKQSCQIEHPAEALAKEDSLIKEKLKVLAEHTKLFEKEFNGIKNFAVMKKHFKSYLHGLAGAKKLRERLMEAENAQDVEKMVQSFLGEI